MDSIWILLTEKSRKKYGETFFWQPFLETLKIESRKLSPPVKK
ncbi:MAG: hypothetical protein Q6366_014565 [Candidatus Freyarchaeota archaeon]